MNELEQHSTGTESELKLKPSIQADLWLVGRECLKMCEAMAEGVGQIRSAPARFEARSLSL
jgi:hypothetical protein